MDNTLLIANLFRSHELNAQFTGSALVLPETVGFKAEAVDEEGIWVSLHCQRRKQAIRDRSSRLTAGMQSGIAAYVIHVRSEYSKRKKKGHQR